MLEAAVSNQIRSFDPGLSIVVRAERGAAGFESTDDFIFIFNTVESVSWFSRPICLRAGDVGFHRHSPKE
jgi:hypothetical protein